MEVLLEIEQSRIPLTVDKDNVVYTVEEELGKIGLDGILAHFSCPRGEKRHGNKNVFILQRFSDKFKLFVDVTNVEQINDGDRLTIVQANCQASSSSDATNGQVCCIMVFVVVFVKQ